ncbi:hypothetical protein QF032_007624 [Streptomyces achromogenes]|uniref:Uncharacterized protein n=1 Tax=Streptomyces achromogenes TaxID=67255 RepID=A0ABU0QD69_STRAH|nr:hypothetical protein [Streptomyces achromogenes]MDQ0835780.1 hypothetical protein [Streptomyces achromogenes]
MDTGTGTAPSLQATGRPRTRPGVQEPAVRHTRPVQPARHPHDRPRPTHRTRFPGLADTDSNNPTAEKG